MLKVMLELRRGSWKQEPRRFEGDLVGIEISQISNSERFDRGLSMGVLRPVASISLRFGTSTCFHRG